MAEPGRNFDLSPRQRAIRGWQQQTAASVALIRVDLWSGGARVVALDGDQRVLGGQEVGDVEDTEREAAARVIEVLAAADGRLLRSGSFAPWLAAELRRDARLLRDRLLAEQGAESWEIDRAWFAAAAGGGRPAPLLLDGMLLDGMERAAGWASGSTCALRATTPGTGAAVSPPLP